MCSVLARAVDSAEKSSRRLHPHGPEARDKSQKAKHAAAIAGLMWEETGVPGENPPTRHGDQLP